MEEQVTQLWQRDRAVCSFVLSQSTCVTDRRTDRQNYDPQDRASIVASHGKN